MWKNITEKRKTIKCWKTKLSSKYWESEKNEEQLANWLYHSKKLTNSSWLHIYHIHCIIIYETHWIADQFTGNLLKAWVINLLKVQSNVNPNISEFSWENMFTLGILNLT